MRTITLSCAAATLTLSSLPGCMAGTDPDESARDTSVHIHATHGHTGAEHSRRHGAHRSHDAPGALSGLMVRAGDLPAGYRSGAAHHQDVAVADELPRLREGCGAIAGLISNHPAYRSPHPQVRRVFTKSHFGPEISETVIDIADEDEAAAESERFADAVSGCGTYVQYAGGSGATRYDVRPRPALPGIDRGYLLRLDALGSDFVGIHWDVWVDTVGERVVAVSLRSARGGTSEDLAPAVRAALERLEEA